MWWSPPGLSGRHNILWLVLHFHKCGTVTEICFHMGTACMSAEIHQGQQQKQKCLKFPHRFILLFCLQFMGVLPFSQRYGESFL